MGHYQDLYFEFKNNPKNVRFEDLDKLLQKFGRFERRAPRSGSSHYTYSHPDLFEILTIPKERPLKIIYVKKAIKALEAVIDELNN